MTFEDNNFNNETGAKIGPPKGLVNQWRKYPKMNSILKEKTEMLKQLLNRDLYWELKRDGSNISIMRKNGEYYLFSRNGYILDATLNKRVREILSEYKDNLNIMFTITDEKIILYGEFLDKGKSPAGFEIHNQREIKFFDIYSIPDQHFFSPDAVYDFLKLFDLPVVKLVKVTKASTIDELFKQRNGIVSEIEKQGFEGVVLKTYTDKLILYKEKVDARKVARIRPGRKPRLPPLPKSEIMGAIDKAYWQLGPEKFRDKRLAMPLISKLVREEAKKHECEAPKNVYRFYLEYLESK